MNYSWGHSRRYNDFGSHVRLKFNGKVQKISINAGFTCPNRDGTKGTGGCTFCNNNSFKPLYCEPVTSVRDQVERGISVFRSRHPGANYIAYFQSYTNTYAAFDTLVALYEEALSCNGVVGIIVGTRPDCLTGNLLDYFADLKDRTHVTIELGVESTSNETLELINRGHNFEQTIDAFLRLSAREILSGAHLILGLPGETREQMINHAVEISKLPVNYLKIHQLQFISGSRLGTLYQENPDRFKVFDVNEYVELVVDFIERLSPCIVIERFASQAPGALLLAPRWGLKNFELARVVENRLETRGTWQGRLYHDN